jgi:hypothetical protein
MCLYSAVLIAIFQAVKGTNNYWRCLQNRSLILSNAILYWSHLHPLDLYKQASHIRDRGPQIII